MRTKLENALSGKLALYISMSLTFVLMLVYIYLNEDHEGGEDNISLFLLSKFGPLHPTDLFASPIKILYTMVMSIPAQMGFKAAQITNALLACATAFLSVKIAKKTGITNSWLIAILILFSPIYFVMSLTVLSEILFSFVLVNCIYLISENKYLGAVILLSFLPYIRSEGFILMIPFVVYIMIQKQWKYIPLLGLGTLVFMLAGYPIHHDLFWVFNKNYGNASNIYGHGEVFEFIKGTINFNGRILTFLLPVAALFVAIKFKTYYRTQPLFLFLIMGCYFGFLALHDLLWWKGMGASLGLTRVMASVMPLAGIIGAWVLQETKKYMYGFHIYIWIVLAVVHIMSGFQINHLPRKTDASHTVIKKLFEENKAEIMRAPQVRFTSFYFCFLSGADPYDKKNGNCWTINEQTLQEMKSGGLVQYEASFGPNECGIPIDYFDKRNDFERVMKLDPETPFTVLNGYSFFTALYRKK